MARRHRAFRIHYALFSLLFFALMANFCGMLPSLIEISFQETSELLSDAPENDNQVPRKAVSSRDYNPKSIQHVDSLHTFHANRTMQFIPRNNLDKLDYFSATWIQPMSTFLKLDTERIINVEMGVFRVWHENLHRMRMTLDWLDFSVEHLSKYWKNAQVFSPDPVPYAFITGRLERYIQRTNLKTSNHVFALQETIAVIAFQPYTNRRKPQEGRNLTILSLAATMASMIQVGFGRILVVGYEPGDAEFAYETFSLLVNHASVKSNGNDTLVTNIGNTEVGYVNVSNDEVASKITRINRVKGALTGLQLAIKGEMDASRLQEWLGVTRNASFWRYVYLTEPDTILQTRPLAIPQIRKALDNGLILAPHRLQPLPHESDLKGMKNKDKFLPALGKFENVIQLDPLDSGVCCDELGGTFRPFQKFERCGSFWWQCGFNSGRNHSRLEEYQLIRLESGTGIVSLAGSEHGRRCVPNTNGVCSLPQKWIFIWCPRTMNQATSSE